MKNSVHKAKVEGNWFLLFGVFISVVMILIGKTSNTESNEYYIGIAAVFIVGCLVYVLAKRTRYILRADKLIIKFFLYTNELPYKYIQHIKKSNYPSAGRKAAWAKEGLTIYYNQGNMLFIAPEKREEFLIEISALADHIQIIEK